MIVSIPNEAVLSPSLNRFLRTVDSHVFSMMFEFPRQMRVCDAVLENVNLGWLNILRYTGHGLQKCHRQRKHILGDRGDDFFLCLPQRSEYGISYAGVEAKAPPNSMVFLSSDRPFQAYIHDGPTHMGFTALYVRVPGSLLRQRVPGIDAICGRFIPITPGIVRAMESSFYIALEDGPYLREDDAEVLSATILDLIGQVAKQSLGENSDPVFRLSALEQTLRRAKSFINANLSDHDLSLHHVADHCRVSTRYLNRVFSKESTSVMAFIRETRLQRCREALHCGDLSDISIAEISAQWGFTSLSHFSQVYKSRFGVSPSAERKLGLADSGNT